MSKIFRDFAKEVVEEAVKEAEQRRLLSDLKTLMKILHLMVEQAMDALCVPS